MTMSIKTIIVIFSLKIDFLTRLLDGDGRWRREYDVWGQKPCVINVGECQDKRVQADARDINVNRY